MHDKTNELRKGNTIEVYDKNLISFLQRQVSKTLIAKQTESCFLVHVATNRELNKAFKEYKLANGIDDKDGNALNKFMEEETIIWQ